MGELLNLIGLSSGIALYAMLLAMVIRAARATGAAGVDPLLVSTGVLGLVWNLCALPAYELPRLGIMGSVPTLVALGYSALGFLPAVVVHSVLRGEHGDSSAGAKRLVAAASYCVSASAAVLHFHGLWSHQPVPSVFGMRLLTYSFILLVVPLFAVTRGQPGSRRALWVAALSIFAVSALHLSQLHTGDASWPIELLGHHASLPLAVAILYQDFPFAFADLFLKRTLTLLTLVAAAFIAVVSVGVEQLDGTALTSARNVAVLVTLWVATALLYPRLRSAIAWFVDQVVLNRPDYEALRAEIGQRIRHREEVSAVLDEACAQLAPALSARTVRWHEGQDIAKRQARHIILIDIPVAEPPRFALEVSELLGGRRLLSDDRKALDDIAVMLGRRIDSIRLSRERYNRQLREQEMAQLATEAELRALRSQINPHFLFNALTTIGYLIQTAPSRAFDTLMRLTALMRGVLRSDGALTTLGRELTLIEAYLDIERARFDERLRVRIDVPVALREARIPPLVLQPIVENAIKHGIAPLRHGGEVSVTACVDRREPMTPMLVISVRDSGVGIPASELRRRRELGVGLNNVERRLTGQCGSEAALTIQSERGAGTTVELRLPADFTVVTDGPLSRAAV